jgi:hypothetical protein
MALVPMRRHLTGSCCTNPEHAPYRHEEGFCNMDGKAAQIHYELYLFTIGMRNLRVISVGWLMAGPRTSDGELQELAR